MARPQKQTADYFPHYATHGKTMYIIEAQFGVAGYAAWFKLLELLCNTPGHCYYARTDAETAFLTAKTGFTDTEILNRFMEALAMLDAIDKELWLNARGIWSQNLVDNLGSMYQKRKEGIVPTKPVYGDDNQVSVADNPINVSRSTQSKVEESRVNNSRVEESSNDNDFPKYIKMLQTTRYPNLNVEECWVDCYTWYKDHGKVIKDVKRALDNWCKKENKIHPPVAAKEGAKRDDPDKYIKGKYGHMVQR